MYNQDRTCAKCGQPMDNAKFCPNCGEKFENETTETTKESSSDIGLGQVQFTPSPEFDLGANSDKKKLYERGWFIILLLIFFFPVGLFLMWKYSTWNKVGKIVITVLIALCFVGMIGSNNSGTPIDPDTQMVNSNDNAVLPSDQSDEDAGAIDPQENQAPPEPVNSVTLGQRNALSQAHDYLDYTAFSRSGLIEQLKFEGFSTEDATYAVDNCGADWNQQAALMAQDYLDYTSFSRSGLIDQLKFEGFTAEQAEYGVTSVGY